jgi:tRNA (guanine10-N2)-methyltransferase
VEKKEQRKDTVLLENSEHYPSLSGYKLHTLYNDLLNFSAKRLKMNGRTVFWLPVVRKEYHENLIPKHTALQLIYNCEQKLVGETSRRLLVYEKIKEFGNLVDSNSLKNLNFREKYFSNDGCSRQEKRLLNHQHNVTQAQSRGIFIKNKTEWKKSLNKKRFQEDL